MSELLHALNAQMSTVVSQVLPSLVRLSDGRRGHGAGTIWHSQGLILTNAHVVQGHAPKVTLWDGRSFPSRLLCTDERRDLAALAIEASDLPAIQLSNGKTVLSGQWAVALGHPWGVIGATSAGTVIDVGRPPELSWYPGELIQVALQLRPGHSGGPLASSSGRLIGINTMIAGPQVGLAIPLQVVKQFLSETLGQAATIFDA
jgi:serine protease Do